ncbi:hypothetical protein As57867_004603, partial [Aphanomyces stellatus]
MSTSDDFFTAVQVPLGFVAAFFMFGVLPLCCFRFFRNIDYDLDGPLLPNEQVGHLRGLTRDKLEDKSKEALKWTCGVCDFHNPQEMTTCELCNTSRAMFILETPEFASMEGTIPLDRLNPKQRSARFRQQWRRHVIQGQWHWVADMKPIDGCIYYIIGAPTEGQSLALLPLSTVPQSAGLTVTGTPLPTWWFSQLEELRELAFSLKYAWLLSNLAITYTAHAKLTLERTAIFEESIDALVSLEPAQSCSLTQIQFVGESAIDAGGVAREWYSLLALAILEPKQGLFITNKTDQSFFI